MPLADVFAGAVVNELVDHAAARVTVAGVARSRAAIDADHHRRTAAANDDRLRWRRRSRDRVAPVTPARDAQLIPPPAVGVPAIPAKAAEAETVEAVEAEAVKPVGAETVDAEAGKAEAVEPARRDKRKKPSS